MKSKIIFLVGLVICLGLASALPGHCATYYVRPDGGTTTQCTGLTDAAYPGSGTGQACAFSNLMWATGPFGGTGVIAGGDTVIIKKGSYKMGYGAGPTTGSCGSTSSTFDCIPGQLPSGPDAAHPTQILGEGWDTGCSIPPEIWGTERVARIIDLRNSSNINIKCLEITDHASCGYSGSSRSGVYPSPCSRDSYPHGDYAENGIVGYGGHNIVLQDLNIHGLAEVGVYLSGTDITATRVRIYANGLSGWNFDTTPYGDAADNRGTLTFDHLTIQYSGCTETYPGKLPANCIGQNDGGYAYGDGIGTWKTGGNWIFLDSNISFNTQDGLDLLYASRTGTSNVTIKRSKFEGNAGNQAKINVQGTPSRAGGTLAVENSIFVGNCDYFDNGNPGYSLRAPGASFDNCRADGTTLFVEGARAKTHITNSTITGRGFSLVGFADDFNSESGGCDGTEEVKFNNNIFMGNYAYRYGGGATSVWLYNGGTDGNGTGNCGSSGAYNMLPSYLPRAATNNIVYNVSSASPYASCPSSLSATNLCQDPKLVAAPTNGYVTNVNLQSASPVRDKASVIAGLSSLDYNDYDRGTSWDIGALEYGSTPQTQQQSTCANGIQFCTTQTDCTSYGYYWYNNQCNSTPQQQQTCANGIQYCTTQTDCVNNGHYWYNNQCNSTAQQQQTCANGVQYCTTQADCTKQGYYWYTNSCHGTPQPQPTCADGIQYCTTQTDCVNRGYYWYNNACNASPEQQPTCANGIQYCTTQTDCVNNGHYWYNNTCNNTAQPKTCADGIQYCTTQTDCVNNGHYWYNNTCNTTAQQSSTTTQQQSSTTTQQQQTCANNIQYCTTQTACVNQGYYWYNRSCKAQPQAKQAPRHYFFRWWRR